MSKNIVIFADGTGQEGGVGNNTNVYDLFNMITDRSPDQISYYDRGLGTGWSRFGSISGFGISRNVRECYQFLSDNFDCDDQIYLFGFSRGAATVRALSSFIHLFGILPRSRPELIRRAWRIYRIRDADKRRRRADEFVRRNHTMWARVRFLGVWDSVAALGLPFRTLNALIDQIPWFRHSFHDLSLAKSVEYARHALAVDDQRLTFHPHLWDETEEPPQENSLFDDDVDEFYKRPIRSEDIDDVFLVAHKLKEKDHPVTKRLSSVALSERRAAESATDFNHIEEMLRRATAFDHLDELIKHFDRDVQQDEGAGKIDELKRTIVDAFMAVLNSDEPIYDQDLHEEFDRIALSAETKKWMARYRKLRKNGAPAGSYELLEITRRLNRLLIEDAYSLRPSHRPRIKQVWFPGMHTDVGGGYPENELAHIALVWMVREAIDFGLLIYDKHRVDLNPNATGLMHNSRSGMASLYRRRTRRWDRDTHQGRSPLVHESVVMRSRRDDLRYEPWILKTKYDLEPWPPRLMGSIQFDDYHIWREAFWGWDTAFVVPWSAVERIACDEQERTITIHLNERDIVIEGCLPRSLSGLAEKLGRQRERLERRREHDRLEEEGKRLMTQDQKLEEQDALLSGLLEELEDKVNRITLENRIVQDNVQDERMVHQAIGEQDTKTAAMLEKLKNRIATIEKGLTESRSGASVESKNDDAVAH